MSGSWTLWRVLRVAVCKHLKSRKLIKVFFEEISFYNEASENQHFLDKFRKASFSSTKSIFTNKKTLHDEVISYALILRGERSRKKSF